MLDKDLDTVGTDLPSFPEILLAEPSRNENEIEKMPDIDVERDVAVRMAFRSTEVINPTIVPGGALKPCLIFPAELPDE